MELKDLRKFVEISLNSEAPRGFAAYLIEADMSLAPDRRIELQGHVSNWSYLSLFLRRCPSLLASEVAAMLYHELVTKRRTHIIKRLFSHWQKKMRMAQWAELEYFARQK